MALKMLPCVTDVALGQSVMEQMEGLDDEQRNVCVLWRQHQWQSPSSQHVSPRRASIPSFAMIGTITSAAMGSAHHQPKSAFSPRPLNKIVAIDNEISLA